MDANQVRGIEETIRNAPPVQKAGDIFTLGSFERAIQGLERSTRKWDLQHPRSGDYSPRPVLEELRQAAFGTYGGAFERAILNISPENPEDDLPEPPQEVLRQAVQNVRKAFGKRAFLHTPEGTLEGTLRPTGWLGVYFTHYEGLRAGVKPATPK